MSQVFWRERPGARRDRPCLFLDRDGVIVDEVNYLHRAEDVRLLPGIRDLVVRAADRGMAVGMVTNQAGVARGYYGWDAFEAVLARILALLDCGDVFDVVAACGTHPEGTIADLQVDGHSWRKPMPGMLVSAAAALGLDLPASVMIGDQLSDIEAADKAGVGHVVHVRTGHGIAQRPSVADHRLRSGGRVHLIETLDEVAGALGWNGKGGGDGS